MMRSWKLFPQYELNDNPHIYKGEQHYYTNVAVFFFGLWWPFWKWPKFWEFWRRILTPLMKFRWNRTMLNLCGIVAAMLKRPISFLSSYIRNMVELSKLYGPNLPSWWNDAVMEIISSIWVKWQPTHIKGMLLRKVFQTLPGFFLCFGGHFENGRNFENFEDAYLLL
jgi:hypothetical protein